jgi:hypothetical protein
MEKIFGIAAGIGTAWSLAAFGIAAVCLVAMTLCKWKGRKVPPIWWGVIVAVVLLGLVPIVAPLLVGERAIHRVRVTVLGPNRMPVDDARVWSSMGGEAKKVAGGWQFDIPAATKPADGKLTVYASVANAFLSGRQELQLGRDLKPTVTVQLRKETGAQVRGIVADESGRGMAGALVSVAGYEKEAVKTTEGGNFTLPAHAADGQQVLLHAEKEGYQAVNHWHPAGDFPATITLKRK